MIIVIFADIAKTEYQNSRNITESLTKLHLEQTTKKYDLQHSLSSKKGGFVSLRRNHVRNITANLIDQVCHDVRVEPPPQTLTGKTFDSRSMYVRDEARLDISVRTF